MDKQDPRNQDDSAFDLEEASIARETTLYAQIVAIREVLDGITLDAVPDEEIEYVDAHLTIARAHLTLALSGLVAEERWRDEPVPRREPAH